VANKFILIDQSISSVAGHHYEYAVHVLEAAQRAGFEPYLATNRRFPQEEERRGDHTMPQTETHNEKLDLRLTPSAKRALQIAAARTRS